MRTFLATVRGRPFRLYLLGLLCIFAGAWAMGASGSMLPMAAASAAGLMLSVPLLRQLVQRALRPVARRPSR